MNVFENILTLIDLRSFSSVWFWIMVALFWSTVSHSVLGASYELIVQARKGDGQALADMEALVDITVRRKLALAQRVGHWVTAFVAAVMTLVFVLAFFYGLELAQAVFLLALPLTIVRLMALRLAYRIDRQHLRGAKLIRALLRHRFWVQVLGLVAIFVTAVWGMIYVMSRSVLFA